MRPPTFGRPSAASDNPWQLAPRDSAAASVRADAANNAWCALRAATVVGVRHRLRGMAAEDAWAWAGDDDLVAVAVADGVGSLPTSAPVSLAVAQAAVAHVADRDTTGLSGDARGAQLMAAACEANAAVAEVTDGASTLVLGVVGPDGAAELIRVGDSTAFVLSGGSWTELFVDGDGDEMRVPATAALPTTSLRIESGRCQLSTGDVLVLVTDGVGDPLRDGPETVGPGLAAGLAAPLHPAALVALTDFSRQGCHDDRTIVALWWRPEGDDASAILVGDD